MLKGNTHYLWDTKDHSEDKAVKEAYCYPQARQKQQPEGSKKISPIDLS